MEQTNKGVLTLTRPASTGYDQLFGFYDSVSGMWVRFYRPADRFDLWEIYAAGAVRTYHEYDVQGALRLPDATPDSTTPLFAVAWDNDDIVAGWYINGPLTAVNQAVAPSEFAADPVSATLIADWISHVLPDGAIEIKAVWTDPSCERKRAASDLLARSFVHAMHALGVRYAFCTAAEHAAPRWMTSGSRPLPGIVPTPYPDERYLTSFFRWDIESAFRLSTTEQRRLFFNDLRSAQRALVGAGEAAA